MPNAYEGVIELKGSEKGPTSMILAGVHGDEMCGVEALEKVLPSLIIEKGRILIGYGNPRAIEARQRSIETNLNRMFKNENLLSEDTKRSYEYGRAQFLKNYLDQADAVLDIHASHTPDSQPFLICEANAKGIAKYFPIDLLVSGFDHLEPGGADYYMNSIGGTGMCLECGFLTDAKSVQIAKESIMAFLKARGHIKNDLSPRAQSSVQMKKIYITKTDDFALAKTWADFEEVFLGQIIGVDGSEEIKAEKDGVILFARDKAKAGEEAFLFGEKESSSA
jgi:uncharacterized protein